MDAGKGNRLVLLSLPEKLGVEIFLLRWESVDSEWISMDVFLLK